MERIVPVRVLTDAHSMGLAHYFIPWIAITNSPTITMPKKCAKTTIMARKNAWKNTLGHGIFSGIEARNRGRS